MKSSTTHTLLLDCIGLPCPEPVIRCQKAIRELRPAHLTIIVDNMAANENVTRSLKKHGYATICAEERQQEKQVWRLEADAQGASAETAPMPSTRTATQQEEPQKTLVLLTSETLGTGNDELGVRLMENFLATLPEMGENLWKIVLLNGGVRLAAKPGKSLESLKALEAAGVHVLVCGACLTFYNLLESKAVGETTNMLDVVTSLDLANKIIRP